MDVALIVVMLAVLTALGVAAYYIRTLDERVSGILADAIAKEIRMQDDRIQKRVQRMEGQPAEEAQTPVDSAQPTIGRPYRRS